MDIRNLSIIATTGIIILGITSTCHASTCAETVDYKLGCVCGEDSDCVAGVSRCTAGYCQKTRTCDESCPCDAPFACVVAWPGDSWKYCSYCTPAGAPVAVTNGCCSGLKPNNTAMQCETAKSLH